MEARQSILDAVGHRPSVRVPLAKSDWREAKRLGRHRIEQLENTIPNAKDLTYSATDVSTASATWADKRREQVSQRMAAYWRENSRRLDEFFRDTKLRHITPAQSRRTRTLAPIRAVRRTRSTARSRCSDKF